MGEPGGDGTAARARITNYRTTAADVDLIVDHPAQIAVTRSSEGCHGGRGI